MSLTFYLLSDSWVWGKGSLVRFADMQQVRMDVRTLRTTGMKDGDVGEGRFKSCGEYLYPPADEPSFEIDT